MSRGQILNYYQQPDPRMFHGVDVPFDNPMKRAGLLDEITLSGMINEVYRSGRGLLEDLERGFSGTLPDDPYPLGRPMEQRIEDVLAVVPTSSIGASLVTPPMVKQGEKVLGTLIGKAGADKDQLKMLEKAERMKAEGRTAGEIYEATKTDKGTGWWLDHPDGVPRLEVSDDLYSYRPQHLANKKYLSADGDTGQYKGGVIGDAVSHPGIRNRYPSLMDAKVIDYPFSNSRHRGIYQEADSVFPEHIKLWGEASMPISKESTMLHEMQHAIQRREGFSRGGNKNMFKQSDLPISEKWLLWKANKEQADRVAEILDMPEYRKQRNESNVLWKSGGYDKRVDNLMDSWPENASKAVSDEHNKKIEAVFEEYKRTIHERFPLLKEVNSMPVGVPVREPTKQISREEAYKRLAGETEARLAQDRKGMTLPERMEKPFYEGYDYPLEWQILRDDADTIWVNGKPTNGLLPPKVTQSASQDLTWDEMSPVQRRDQVVNKIKNAGVLTERQIDEGLDRGEIKKNPGWYVTTDDSGSNSSYITLNKITDWDDYYGVQDFEEKVLRFSDHELPRQHRYGRDMMDVPSGYESEYGLPKGEKAVIEYIKRLIAQ